MPAGTLEVRERSFSVYPTPDMSIREVIQGEQEQGTTESVIYRLDVTNWGSSPTSPTVVAYDSRDRVVTSQLFPSGSPSVASNVITLPACVNVYRGERYRVVVRFTLSGNILSAVIPIRGSL